MRGPVAPSLEEKERASIARSRRRSRSFLFRAPIAHDPLARNATRGQQTSPSSEISGPRAPWTSKSARRPLPWATGKGSQRCSLLLFFFSLFDRKKRRRRNSRGRRERSSGRPLFRSLRCLSSLARALKSPPSATEDAVFLSKPSNVPRERPCAGRRRRPVLGNFEKEGEATRSLVFRSGPPREDLESKKKRASLRILSGAQNPVVCFAADARHRRLATSRRWGIQAIAEGARTGT